MADELDELELVNDDEDVQAKRQDKRLKDLSEKVKLTAEERDEKDRLLQEKDSALQQAQKDAEFYKNFNALQAKYPGASEFQDAIREKVNAGYDPDDAVVAILNKEGKLPGMTQAPVTENPAGGSAATVALGEGEKSPDQMNQAERRAELEKQLGSIDDLHKAAYQAQQRGF